MSDAGADSQLPAQFADLARFAKKWDQPGTNQRYALRLSSTMDELQDFHDALLPRIESIRKYLDARGFAEYTEADLRLARLVFAWVPVAEAVEVFKQPRVPQSKMYWDVKVEPEL